MRLTSPIGLGLRALLSATIAGLALLASVYVVGAFAAEAILVVAAELGPVAMTERNILWTLAVGSTLVLPFFALVVAAAVRRERRQLLEGTVPVDEIDAETARALEATATRLANQFDVAPPQLRLRSESAPLAYTTSRPSDPVVSIRRRGAPIVVLSRGLVQTLPERELEAVLAHEFAHLANDDLQLISWLLVPLFAAEFLYDNDEDEKWQLDPLGWVLTTVALVGIGVFSRGRELAADRGAAAATGDPGALAAALERLAERPDRRPSMDLRHARSTSAINVLPTLGDGETGGLRATHPPLEARLEALRPIAAERGP